MTSYRKLQFIYLACHLLPVYWFITHGSSWFWLWVSLALYFFLQVVGVGIGLHRFVAHLSFKPSAAGEHFLLLISALTAMGSPISWAGIHRLHHQCADTERDPHSPYVLGFWGIILGRYNESARIPPHLIRDLIENPWHRWIHRHYFLIHLCYAGGLLILGINFFIYCYCLPTAFVYWATALGIFLNHRFGYRNFETSDKSVNSWLLSLYTLGDGWHNNHHHNPNSYDHRVHWWELDLCAFLIKWFWVHGKKPVVPAVTPAHLENQR